MCSLQGFIGFLFPSWLLALEFSTTGRQCVAYVAIPATPYHAAPPISRQLRSEDVHDPIVDCIAYQQQFSYPFEVPISRARTFVDGEATPPLDPGSWSCGRAHQWSGADPARFCSGISFEGVSLWWEKLPPV